MKSLIFAMSLLSLIASGRELGKVSEPDEMIIDGHKMILNGMAMRQVTKFGFDVDVYVGALYLDKKSSDTDAILKSDETKVMVMHFVRQLDRDTLLDAFRTGYENGCYIECDKKSDQLGLLTPNLVSVRKDNEIKFTFYKDKVEIDTNGPNAKKAMIDSTAVSHNLLSMFINKKSPPTQKFRSGVLGLETNEPPKH